MKKEGLAGSRGGGVGGVGLRAGVGGFCLRAVCGPTHLSYSPDTSIAGFPGAFSHPPRQPLSCSIRVGV